MLFGYGKFEKFETSFQGFLRIFYSLQSRVRDTVDLVWAALPQGC